MNWLPFCSRAPSSATPGTASQARRAPGIEGAEAGQQRQRQHADEELLEVAGDRDEMHRPQQEERARHERRSPGQPDAARQRVQAPPRERDAEERGPVEGRRGAPRPERQRQDGVERPDAVDQHRDAVRPQQMRGVRPADAARQRLRRVPQDPDRVALVVVDVADGIGREVAGERPACRDGEGEITEGNRGGAGPASKETGHVGREYSGWRPGPGLCLVLGGTAAAGTISAFAISAATIGAFATPAPGGCRVCHSFRSRAAGFAAGRGRAAGPSARCPDGRRNRPGSQAGARRRAPGERRVSVGRPARTGQGRRPGLAARAGAAAPGADPGDDAGAGLRRRRRSDGAAADIGDGAARRRAVHHLLRGRSGRARAPRPAVRRRAAGTRDHRSHASCSARRSPPATTRSRRTKGSG